MNTTRSGDRTDRWDKNREHDYGMKRYKVLITANEYYMMP